MAPSEPRRAILAGAILAGSLGLLSGGLIFANSTIGLYVFLALPFAIALVAAWFVHAIDAMLIATTLTACVLFLIGWLCDCLEGMVLTLPILSASLAAGGILGVIARRIGRHPRNHS